MIVVAIIGILAARSLNWTGTVILDWLIEMKRLNSGFTLIDQTM